MFLYRAVHSFKVYQNQKMIYSYGDMGSDPLKLLTNMHIIPLPSLAKNGEILFYFHSDWKDIGINGIPVVGDYQDILLHSFYLDLFVLIPAFLFLFISAFSFLLYMRYKQNSINVFYSLYSFCMFLVTIYHAHYKILLIPSEKFWSVTGVLAMYTSPLFLLLFCREIFDRLYHKFFNISILFFAVFLPYCAGFLFLHGIDFLYWQFVNIPFIFATTTSFILLAGISIISLKHNQEAGILLWAFTTLLASLVPQILYEAGILDYPGYFVHWGFLGFTLVIGWILVRRYKDVHENLLLYASRLDKANKTLEEKIWEKTAELERSSQKILESEKKLIRYKERQKIFSDLHDHMGSRLTDMSLFLKTLKKSGQSKILENLKQNVDAVISILRNRLYTIEDLETLNKNFTLGLQLRLVRRYTNTERELSYHARNESAINDFMQSKDEKYFFHLSGIIDEICTNDLKYGKGPSTWDVGFISNKLTISLKTQSQLEQNGFHPGYGSESIIRKTEYIGGTALSSKNNDIFHLELLL